MFQTTKKYFVELIFNCYCSCQFVKRLLKHQKLFKIDSITVMLSLGSNLNKFTDYLPLTGVIFVVHSFKK